MNGEAKRLQSTPHQKSGLMQNWLIGFNPAIANVNDAVGPMRNVVFVGNHDDRVTLAMQARKQRHDLIACF